LAGFKIDLDALKTRKSLGYADTAAHFHGVQGFSVCRLGCRSLHAGCVKIPYLPVDI